MMTHIHSLLKICIIRLLLLSLFYSTACAISGTGGTPLGGMGTGYVKYNAVTGDFAASSRLPPAAGDMVSEFENRMSVSSGFHFFAGGQSVLKAKTDHEDAKCPFYSADFSSVNTVKFRLTAFGPFIPGTCDFHTQLITSPLAFFEIAVENAGDAEKEVAVALEFTNRSSTVSGLLGGEDNGVIVAESADRIIRFADNVFDDIPSNPDNVGSACIMSGCDKENAVFSAGGLEAYAATGMLSNSDGNAVGVKCTVSAGEKVRFKFVMAWWRTFVSGEDRYNAGTNDADNYYYHNYYGNAMEAAQFGMSHFDRVSNGISTMVKRVMASNFPNWYKDRLLNNTYPLIQNSIWTKDGRAAFWEGGWGIIGSIDQAQHAALWYTFNWPQNQWQELKYWLSTMYQNSELSGQIHHDFNTGTAHFDTSESRFIAPWNHWERDDYWFAPNTTYNSEQNSMIILKAYELMLATGNRDSIKSIFPEVSTVAKRLFAMCQENNTFIPIYKRSFYDGEPSPPYYECGLAITAYRAMVEIAGFVGNDTTAQKYLNIYEKARSEFKEKLFTSEYGSGSVRSSGEVEQDVAGYSWADYLCLPPIQDQEFIEEGCTRIWDLKSQHPKLIEKIGGWHFSSVDHLGGALTGIGKPDIALELHKWDYQLCYKNHPDEVFRQPLFSSNIGTAQYQSYMTAPTVWRSYFQFIGYMLDNANKRLWIRPRIPSEMEGKIENAPLINPQGWGTLYYEEIPENPSTSFGQKIFLNFDSPVEVKEIVLKNTSENDNPFVRVSDGTGILHGLTTVAENRYHERNMKITFTTPIQIGPEGIKINVNSTGVTTYHKKESGTPLSIISTVLHRNGNIIFSIKKPGLVTIALYSLDGVCIGTILKRRITSSGEHMFTWNGTTVRGKKVRHAARTFIVRLSTPEGSVARRLLTGVVP